MPDPRPELRIRDEDDFRRELGHVLRTYNIDRYLEFDTTTAVARVVEFIELMRTCHEADRDIALLLGPERRAWSVIPIPPISAPPSTEAVIPQQIPKHKWKQDDTDGD